VTYNGRCFVGVNTDTRAIPDNTCMIDSLRAGFDEIAELAGRPPETRHVTA
jgi:hypothetical protein